MANYGPAPSVTVEDAFKAIVSVLQPPVNRRDTSYGYDLYLPNVVGDHLSRHYGTDPYHTRNDLRSTIMRDLSPVFYEAAWILCRRGILRPGVAKMGSQNTSDGDAGNGYALTLFGRQWLSEGGSHEYVPPEPGRFAETLRRYTPRFGTVFDARAQESFRCYNAHAYLACCAMTGAAAEAIVIALITAKLGDEAKVKADYFAGGGRGRVEKQLLGQHTQAMREQFKVYSDLMKYWRDNSAHGYLSVVDEAEAYTSLALLLRLAQFANDRWGELTEPNR